MASLHHACCKVLRNLDYRSTQGDMNSIPGEVHQSKRCSQVQLEGGIRLTGYRGLPSYKICAKVKGRVSNIAPVLISNNLVVSLADERVL
mmetsp:Transcript_428/g.840  ORF Transcript_428/g.840 Transcript_428/m.840 type:complete len:90 (+) Transcript_428:85-354(+)